MTKFIAVMSGKGGVGKTTTTLNIAKGFSDQGSRVLVVDGNVMTPHVALQLGIMNPEKTLNNFLKRKSSMKSSITEHHSGVDMILSSPSFNESKTVPLKRIDKIFRHLDGSYDVVLIDCPSGLGYEVSSILKYTDEAIVVANPQLPSVVDALKASDLAKTESNFIVGLVLNMTKKSRHELSANQVEEMVGLPVIGAVPHDRKVLKAQHNHELSSHLYPRAKSSKQFQRIAEFMGGK